MREKICPKCGEIANYEPYFQSYYCCKCGWTERAKEFVTCLRCNKKHELNDLQMQIFGSNMFDSIHLKAARVFDCDFVDLHLCKDCLEDFVRWMRSNR